MQRSVPRPISLTRMAIALAGYAVASNAFALSAGVAGFSGATGADCTEAGCHAVETPAVPVPTLTLTGPSEVMPGSVNTYTLEISGGPGVDAALDVAASDGSLAVAPGATDTRLDTSEIVHTAPKPMVAGMASFSFEWTAPMVNGTYTLFAAGMATDGGAATLPQAGDGTALTSLDVMVAGASNQAPTAVISAPANAADGMPVNFDGSGSSDVDGTISTYEWDFGDGTTGAGATVEHAFAAGTYTVTLTVTDDMGDVGTALHDITVAAPGEPLPPTADAGGPYNGSINAEVVFDGSASSDVDGTIASYDWDFGDGNTAVGATASNIFAAEGTYTVILTVMDDSGLTATSETTATIDAAAADPMPDEDLYVQFCESCHGAGGVGGPDGDVVGESAEDIQEAIIEYPEMTFLAEVLTEEEVAAIAGFLNPDAAAGEGLYVQFCESCHGPGGVGGPDGDVVGESAEDIQEAIVEYPEMAFLASVVTEEDIAAMGAFLEGAEEEEEESEGTPASTPAPGNTVGIAETPQGGAAGSGSPSPVTGSGSPAAGNPPAGDDADAGDKLAVDESGAGAGGWLALLAALGLAMAVGRRRSAAG